MCVFDRGLSAVAPVSQALLETRHRAVSQRGLVGMGSPTPAMPVLSVLSTEMAV